ncbi:MAG: formate dehydrogenase subunit gamma [Lautropia sp.]
MSRLIVRYADGTRINHWFVALMFLCAGLSGLAFFHPVFFGFTGLFGGPVWTKILHPFFGLLMVAGFVLLFVQVWRDNRWTRLDTEWVRNAPALLRGHEDQMPPVGKYNAGQKAVFWLFTLCLVVLLATGFMFWQPWFADAFPIPLRRVAVLLHAIAAFVLVLGVIVHVYAAIWVKGSIGAMTRGTVSAAWARRHHAAWYRKVGE